MAPWLELDGLEGEEEELRAHYALLMLECIDAAVDPSSSDYMDFKSEGQPLVDAVFLPLGLLPSDSFWVGTELKWTAQKI